MGNLLHDVIDKLANDLNNKNGIEGYLFPTGKELKKLRTCRNCEFNKPINLIYSGEVKHTRFCTNNSHYIENDTIQLSCKYNKQHLLLDTWWNRLKLKFRK